MELTDYKQTPISEMADRFREVIYDPGLLVKAMGETVEEIQADADALLEDLGTLPGETPPPGDGGARTPVTPPDLDEQIRSAEKAGDIKTSMSLKNQKLLASRQ